MKKFNEKVSLINKYFAMFNSGNKNLAIRKLKENFNKNPQSSDLAASIALLYQKCEKDSMAKEYYLKALKIDKTNASYLFNYGVLLYGLRDFDKGLKYVKQALEFEENAFYCLTYAKFLYNSGYTKESETYLLAAEKFDTSKGEIAEEIRWNLSFANLRMGNLRIGWKYYEARLNFKIARDTHDAMKSEAILNNQIPEWKGEDLHNKTLIVNDEQGFGDTIQFVRYLLLLIERYQNLTINLICKKPLYRIFQNFGKNINVFFREDNMDEVNEIKADFHIFLMSIPLFFEINYESIFKSFPYINVPKRKKDFPFIDKEKINIGLSWTGSDANPNDVNRSLWDVNELSPLLNNSKINCISLQVGNSTVDRKELTLMKDASPYIDDFYDSLEVINSLDLIITIDTGLAHLAGAANLPCWVLIPKICTDWRWGEDLSYSPWYESLKIYKQKEPDDWSFPINSIVEDLISKFNL